MSYYLKFPGLGTSWKSQVGCQFSKDSGIKERTNGESRKRLFLGLEIAVLKSRRRVTTQYWVILRVTWSLKKLCCVVEYFLADNNNWRIYSHNSKRSNWDFCIIYIYRERENLIMSHLVQPISLLHVINMLLFSLVNYYVVLYSPFSHLVFLIYQKKKKIEE